MGDSPRDLAARGAFGSLVPPYATKEQTSRAGGFNADISLARSRGNQGFSSRNWAPK